MAANEPASPERLKASLDTFKFVSPVRRSLRNSKQSTALVKAEKTISTSLTVVSSGTFEEFKQEIHSLATTQVAAPSTRKRKLKQELDLISACNSSPKKLKRGYAPPEQYACLNYLQDHLQENLDVMFCGVNPGCLSAKVGHHFANPTNHFWRCLHRSELTDRLLPAAEDFTLPQAYNLGLTNLVDRPSAEQAELSKQDMVSGVPVLLLKVARFRPRIVCFVGKGIWEVFIKEASKLVPVPALNAENETSLGSSVTETGAGEGIPIDQLPPAKKRAKASKQKTKGKGKGHKKSTFEWGIQPYKVLHENTSEVKETLFFVMPSTSGRVVSHQINDKVKLFDALRQRVVECKKASLDTSTMVIIPVTKQ